MNHNEMQAEIARLKAENDALKAKQAKGGGLGLKIGDKGGVVLTGMGRFPVTLYQEQWMRLLDFGDTIRAYIAENDAKGLLARKGDKPRSVPLADGETRTASGAIVGGENDPPADAPMPNGHDATVVS